MGKGDKRSRKGKIWRGSYGNTRRHKSGKPAFVAKPKAVKPKKEVAPAEETLFEVPAIEGAEAKAAKPKKAATKKPKAEGEKKAAPKKKKSEDGTAEAVAE